LGTFGIGAQHTYNEHLSVASSLEATIASPKFNESSGFRKEWGWQAFTFNLESQINVTPAVYVKPHIAYSSILDRGLRADARAATIDTDVFSGGLALGADF
jgi:hypothetical protein